MYSISEMKDLKMFRSLIMKVDHVRIFSPSSHSQ